jgi:hypothetical protein
MEPSLRIIVKFCNPETQCANDRGLPAITMLEENIASYRANNQMDAGARGNIGESAWCDELIGVVEHRTS